MRENSSPVKLLIQAGSQIEAGSPIQAGVFRSLVSIEAGSLIQAGSPIQYKPGDAILMTLYDENNEVFVEDDSDTD